jgi:hypothetical protein
LAFKIEARTPKPLGFNGVNIGFTICLIELIFVYLNKQTRAVLNIPYEKVIYT